MIPTQQMRSPNVKTGNMFANAGAVGTPTPPAATPRPPKTNQPGGPVAFAYPGAGRPGTGAPAYTPETKAQYGQQVKATQPGSNQPVAMGQTLQQTLGASPAPAAAPAAAPAPSAPNAAQSTTNPISWLQNFLQGLSSGGSSNMNTGGSAPSLGAPYSVSSNPVAPGSWHGADNSPAQAAAIGNWQNAYNNSPTLQQTLGATGFPGNANTGGSGGGVGQNVWDYLGANYIQSSNPVSPGSWHTSGLGPGSVGAVGAWQNAQALGQLDMAMNGREGMANSDYGYDAAGNFVLANYGAGQYVDGNGNIAGAGIVPPQAGGGASGGGSAPAGGVSPVTSTINPSGVYNSGQTQKFINQQAGEQFENSNADYLVKNYMRPGASLDAGAMSHVAPAVGEAAGNVRSIVASQPLLDEVANQQHLLQGQIGQGQEGIALAQILAELQRTGDYQDIGQMQAMSSLFQQIFGGMGNFIGGLT